MKARTTPLLAALATLAIAATAVLPEPAEARPGSGRGWSGQRHHGQGHGGHGRFWGGVGLGIGIGAIGYGYGYPYRGHYVPYDGWAGYPGYVVTPGVEYVVVEPTPGDRVVRTARPVPLVSRPADPIFYPNQGQGAERVEADRQDCNRWATTQAGALADASIFHRATLACMEGRGYTVK